MSGVSTVQRRIGRAVIFVHQQDPLVKDNAVRAEVETVLHAGRAMDFAARLREHRQNLSVQQAYEYATLAGIGRRELLSLVLPVLEAVDIVSYRQADGDLLSIEEFVGLSAPVVVQTLRVLEHLDPSPQELALLHSVEIASWAPLTDAQHLDQLVKRGFDDKTAARGKKLGSATGINQRVVSSDLGEGVVYNPYVWGTGQVEIARFLRSLPPAERDVLLTLCEDAFDRPGVALPRLAGAMPRIVSSARKVGLIQTATVKSTAKTAASQTYVFSPLLDRDDDQLVTTEALH